MSEGGGPDQRRPSDATLVVNGLRCTFGGVHAVDGATFAVQRGEITGLIGPNGAGKSTVVGCISGSIRPQNGSVLFEGREIRGLSPHQVANLGVIRTFQRSTQFSGMTVLENMLAGCRGLRGDSMSVILHGKRYWRGEQDRAVRRARQLLEWFDLREKEDDLAGSLSGGQARLLELARALMAMPTILILDEPLAGVSPALARRIVGRLKHLGANGMTILVVEHNLPLVEELCSTVVVMALGKVIASGRMGDLRQQQEVVDAYLAG